MTNTPAASKTPVPVARGDNPVRGVNRLFDSFLGDFGFLGGDRFSFPFTAPRPAIDLAASGTAYIVTPELPGLESKDIDLSIADGVLMIKRQIKQDAKSEREGFFRQERAFGSFQRVIELPKDANPEAAQAELKNRLLTVTVDRVPNDAVAQKISIRDVA